MSLKHTSLQWTAMVVSTAICCSLFTAQAASRIDRSIGTNPSYSTVKPAKKGRPQMDRVRFEGRHGLSRPHFSDKRSGRTHFFLSPSVGARLMAPEAEMARPAASVPSLYV